MDELANSTENAEVWELKLYVAGMNTVARRTLSNLKQLTRQHLPGRHEIVIVDLLETPEEAEKAEILAVPTLIRISPAPVKRLVGDLSDQERSLIGLGLK